MILTPLGKRWSDRLVSLPESGMGYTEVTVSMKDGTSFPALVFNCEVLSYGSKVDMDKVKDITVR